jgi:uncharacterized protein (DUF58 family)
LKLRPVLLGGLVFTLLLASMVSLRGEPAALALPFLVYLASAVFSRHHEPRLQVTRTLSAQRITGGKPIRVRIQVINQGGRLNEVLLKDDLGGRTPLEGTLTRLVSLSPGDQIEWEYSIQLQRGEQTFKGLYLEAGDPSGLFAHRELMPAHESVLFYPQIVRLQRIPIRPRQTRGFAGSIPARVAGSGVDFFGVRGYMPGDRLRQINWRLSARRDDMLYTNEFEQERSADVGLILDARLPSYPPSSEPAGNGSEKSLFDHTVQAAAALAMAFLEDGHRLSLLIYGYVLERVFPGYGKRQLNRVMQSLARARPGFNFALESLNYLPTRLFPAGSQLVMVSPLSPYDFSIYRRLRSQGYEIILVSPNPLIHEARTINNRPSLDHAVRLAKVQRELLLRSLRNIQVQVVDWNTDLPLDGALQASLRSPVFRRQLKMVRR